MSADTVKRRGLGRGLSALFDDDEPAAPAATPPAAKTAAPAPASAPAATPAAEKTTGGPARRSTLPVSHLEPGRFQPRRQFDDKTIQELSQSIREHGVLQPLVVRLKPSSVDRYEIIAGERRWRAAQRARLHDVPVSIVTLDDQAAMEIALIENLQREDLNPVDEALGLKRLMDEFSYTQEAMALKIGKSRSYVANALRLLNLPQSVLTLLEKGELTTGHARALITAADPEALAQQIIRDSLSVRDTESLAGAAKPAALQKKKKNMAGKDVDTLSLEKDLANALGMIVTIDPKNEKAGKVTIGYHSLDQLDDLIARLKKRPGAM